MDNRRLMTVGAAALGLLPLLLAPGETPAKTIIVPYVLTVVSTGTITHATDGLDLFGGGDLVGKTYTQTYTVVDTLPAYLQSFSLNNLESTDASVVTTIDGHSYTVSGTGDAGNFYVAPNDGPAFDERAVEVTGSAPNDTYDYVGDSVARTPPQWAGDPAAVSLFQDNTVSGQTGYLVGSVLDVSPGPCCSGPRTGLNFAVTSMSTSYTTTTAFIPEPSAWTLLLGGTFGVGATLRRRQASGLRPWRPAA